MNKIHVLSILAVLVMATGPVGAQDFSESEKLYKKNCRVCHGPKAKGTNSFPKLAGESAELISERLKQYRAGETVGPNSALMKPVAMKLSDDQIEGLASYISTTFP